ncbi:MAG TPA: 3-methyl-2-oxobutanoate hydroxymethyltransferase, partial [Methylotenera sp.]|nr:3-methyl-2-oxobutanoate hydroxymethyltransferase [Methylotenera sp.]
MSLTKLQAKIAAGEKIAMLTCYDATFAKLMELEGVDMLLVGDSLGMVLQGAENTLNVSMHHMTYHT